MKLQPKSSRVKRKMMNMNAAKTRLDNLTTWAESAMPAEPVVIRRQREVDARHLQLQQLMTTPIAQSAFANLAGDCVILSSNIAVALFEGKLREPVELMFSLLDHPFVAKIEPVSVQ